MNTLSSQKMFPLRSFLAFKERCTNQVDAVFLEIANIQVPISLSSLGDNDQKITYSLTMKNGQLTEKLSLFPTDGTLIMNSPLPEEGRAAYIAKVFGFLGIIHYGTHTTLPALEGDRFKLDLQTIASKLAAVCTRRISQPVYANAHAHKNMVTLYLPFGGQISIHVHFAKSGFWFIDHSEIKSDSTNKLAAAAGTYLLTSELKMLLE